MLSIGYDNPGTEPVTAGLLYSPKLRIESEVLMDPWLVDPRTKQGGPSRPALLFFGIARGVGPRAPASEPRADAHAHHHRVELGGAGLGAVEADIAVAVEVARVGAGEPGRGDVDVHADRGHRTLGGFHADALAGQGTCAVGRSEEHTSELQSLMRISYAVFCLKKKKKTHTN